MGHKDGTTYAMTAKTVEDEHICDGHVQCTSFSGPIELHLRRNDFSNVRVKLPDGTLVEDAGFQNGLPRRTEEWLYRAAPSRFFGDSAGFGLAAGLSLGLVAGCAAGLRHRLDSPADVTRALDPLASLRTDRATAVTLGVLVTVFAIGATAGLVGVLRRQVGAVYQFRHVRLQERLAVLPSEKPTA